MRLPRARIPIALTISGSDPSGGAGLEADLKTFFENGVRGMALPTLLTAQNNREVRAVRYLDPSFLKLQWQTLFADSRPDVIKIGALGSRAMVQRIVKLLRSPEAKGIPVVLDPVLLSTSGKRLLERSAVTDLVTQLFPLCRVITPNGPELSLLSGKKLDLENAQAELFRFAHAKPYAVLLKGGHLTGSESVDFLCEQERVTQFRGVRILHPTNPHGSGCALASALAANLALGRSLPQACRRAKAYVFRMLNSQSGLR